MTVTTPPRVSVIVTCYNLGQYLEESVGSVIAQTYQDFEILIVDDGSTDAQTRALLDTFERPQTRVLRVPHRGLAAARNTGLAHATGQYVCSLDADDRLDPEFLAETVRILDSDPAATFVSTWLRMFGEQEWEWKPERCDFPALLCENTVLTAALVRRDAVLAAGGYDEAMPEQGDEDWDLWLTLVEHGHRGVILPRILFSYRRRPGSMSTHSWYGAGHVPLAAYRFRKHSESYRRWLTDVLLYQDSETAPLLCGNDEVEREIGMEMEPAVALRREELAVLQARLASGAAADSKQSSTADHAQELTAQIRGLESALNHSAAEVAALRNSLSWRITGPLRDVYGWWLRQTTKP